MLSRLAALRAKPTHLVIGLMSGTSADGVDAALCELSGQGRGGLKVNLLAEAAQAYPVTVRRRILNACQEGGGNSADLCALNFQIAEVFAAAANAALETAGLGKEAVDLIGSHGQTIWHIPPRGGDTGVPASTGATLQLGEPAVIAERTGIPVVSNFRTRDMAAGGQGAPLVPLVDYLLFSSDTSARVVLNIGGISNVTYLPAGGGMADVLAYDTGPGNMVIDELVQLMTKGAQPYDEDGAIAAAGTVNDVLLEVLLKHEFLQRPPPKSTGREEFGRAYALKIRNWRGRRRGKLPPRDTVATATRFTAVSIAGSLRKFILPKGPLDELIVSGGGALNPVLMRQLACELPGVRVSKSDCYGIPVKSKECIAFAILARETILGRPGNLPSATGAAGPRILGQFTPV
ncbi:MAG: anhydro-N-acetylmuramic acid kinase [Planctomycetota bacterium]